MLDRAAGDRHRRRADGVCSTSGRATPALPASALSGGNQQKVILAKWLAREVGVLLLDEPTQGVDVAAKAQIHALIRDFARRGGGVLVVIQRSRRARRAFATAICALRSRRGSRARLERARQGFDEKQLHAAIGG